MGALGSPPAVTEDSDPKLTNLFSMFDLLELGSSYSVLKGGWWDFSVVTEDSGSTLPVLFTMFGILELRLSHSVSKGGCWSLTSKATWTTLSHVVAGKVVL